MAELAGLSVEISATTALLKRQIDDAERKVREFERAASGHLDRFDSRSSRMGVGYQNAAKMLKAANDNTTRSMNMLVVAAQNSMRSLGPMGAALAEVGGAALGTTAGVAGLTAAMGALGAAATKATLSQEKIMSTLQQATGDATRAAVEYAYVRAEAERLGLAFVETAAQYGKLAAAARGTAMEGQATRDIFRGVSEAAAALKLSADDTGGALNAIQQIMSKGKLSAEELRGQLGERLPGAFNIAARAMGVTTQELDKMLESGSVMANDFLPKFAAELQKTFGAQAVQAATGLQAQFNRLQTATFELSKAVGEAGLSAAVGDVAGRLSSVAGESEGAAKAIGETLGGAVRAAADAAGFLYRNADTLETAFIGLASAKAAMLFMEMATAIRAAGGAMAILNATMLANPAVAVAAAVGAVAAALYDHHQRANEAEESQKRVNDAIDGARKVAEMAVGGISGMTDATRKDAAAKLANAQAALVEAETEVEAIKTRIAARQQLLSSRAIPDPFDLVYGLFGRKNPISEAFENADLSKLDAANGRLADLRANLAGASDAVESFGRGTATVVVPVNAAAKAQEAAAAILSGYKDTLKGLHPEEEARKKRDEARVNIMAALNAGLISFAQAHKDLAAVEKDYQDALKKGSDSLDERRKASRDVKDITDEMTESIRAEADTLKEADRIRRSVMTPMERYAEEQAKLNDLLEKGYISQETYSRALKEADPAFEEAQKSAKETAQILPNIFDRAFDRIGDGLVDLALEGKGALESLQNIGKAVVSSLIADFAKLAAVDLRRMIGFGRAGEVGLSSLFGSSASSGSAASGGGLTSLLGGGNGIGGFDTSFLSGSWLDRQLGGSLTSANNWLSTPFANAPISFGGAPSIGMMNGIDDVGQLGYSAGTSVAGITPGNVLGGIGYGIGAFSNFKSGNVIGGIGNTAAAVMSMIPGLQVAAPIVAIASSLLGGLFGNQKPASKEGGSFYNFGTDQYTEGGDTGKKFSQANRDAAAQIQEGMVGVAAELEKLAGSTKLTTDFFVGVNDRNMLRVQRGAENRDFSRDEAGVGEAIDWLTEMWSDELASGLGPAMTDVIKRIDFSDLEQGLKDLQFAVDFDDTIKALAGNYSLQDDAQKKAKDAVKATTDAFQELLDTTEKLWPSVRQGGEAVTETTRELTSMSAAEAISKGLIRQVETYIGEGMTETVWQDLSGNIVNVTADLNNAVSVWQDVTRTITEGGTEVASAEMARAQAAIRSRVDMMVAGTPERTFTAMESSVAAAKASWDQATIRPLLEMAGYLATEVPAKAAEGLANAMSRLRASNDQGQMSRYLALGGVDLTTGANAAAQYATAIRDVTALQEAGAARTAEMAQEQSLLNQTLLASVGLGEPVSALSVPVADFTAALGLTAAAVGPVTAALDAMQTAAETGTESQTTLIDTVNHLSNLLSAGTIDADQYAAAVGRVTSQMREAVAVTEAQRQGRAAVMATLMPAWRPSTQDVMAGAGLRNDVVLVNTVAGIGVSLTSMLDDVREAAADGTLTVSGVTDAWTILDDMLRAGAITASQYGAFIQDITTQFAEVRAIEDARRAGMVSIAQTVDPVYRPSADTSLSALHLSSQAIVALRGSLDGLYTSARAGTLAASDLYAAEALVREQMTSGAITAEQYTQVIGLITEAWQSSAASEQAIHNIRTENAQAQIQTLQTQISTAEQAESAWKSTYDSVRKFRLGLLTSDLSTLDPQARMNEALRQYRETLARAQGGDQQAAGDLQGLAQTALEAARGYYASSASYATIFNEVQSGLSGVETEAQRQARIQTDSLSTLRQSLTTQQAMLQALQQPSQTDLAPILAGLNSGNLGSLVEWARRQGPDTLQAVLTTADQRLGVAGNTYRYSATAEDIQRINGRMTNEDYLTVGRRIGFTGGIGEFNAWVVARNKQAEYEAAVRAFGAERGYASGTPSAVPGWSVVGEYGPELMRMGGGEQIIPHPQAVSMASAWETAASSWLRPANDRWNGPAPSSPANDGSAEETKALRAEVRQLTATVQHLTRVAADGARQTVGAISAGNAYQAEMASAARRRVAGAKS